MTATTPAWVIPVFIFVIELAAILSLYRGQHKNEQAVIESRFADMEIIAMGVQHSGWPIQLLLDKIASTKADLAEAKIPSLLETIIEKGVPQ